MEFLFENLINKPKLACGSFFVDPTILKPWFSNVTFQCRVDDNSEQVVLETCLEQ